MKTEKEIREIYEEEKKFLDDCRIDDNDYYILQGWVEALECVLQMSEKQFNMDRYNEQDDKS